MTFEVLKKKSKFFSEDIWVKHSLILELKQSGAPESDQRGIKTDLWQIKIHSHESVQNMKNPEEIFLLNAIE